MAIEGGTGMLVHKLRVSRIGDRVGFRLRLPADCDSLSGIGVEYHPGPTALVTPKGWGERTVGQLVLHLGSTPEATFSQTVFLEEAVDENSVATGIKPPDTSLSGITDYGQAQISALDLRIDRRRIRGLFSDLINERLATPNDYTISMLITYRRKEPQA